MRVVRFYPPPAPPPPPPPPSPSNPRRFLIMSEDVPEKLSERMSGYVQRTHLYCYHLRQVFPIISAQRSLPDPKRDRPRPVFAAGPQPAERMSE